MIVNTRYSWKYEGYMYLYTVVRMYVCMYAMYVRTCEQSLTMLCCIVWCGDTVEKGRQIDCASAHPTWLGGPGQGTH